MSRTRIHRLARIALLAFAATTLVGCGSTSTKPARKAKQATPVRIEIQEDIGFTIVEKARIDGDVRLDYERALGLLGQGQVTAGIELLESVVETAPELSAPRIDLAIAYHRQGDLESAERHLVAALEVNPNHPIALNELGIVYRKTARFAEAKQSYEAALDVYPGYHYARRNLAVLCDLYLDDLDCALGNYEAYMATVDSDDEAEMWLKAARFRAGQTE